VRRGNRDAGAPLHLGGQPGQRPKDLPLLFFRHLTRYRQSRLGFGVGVSRAGAGLECLGVAFSEAGAPAPDLFGAHPQQGGNLWAGLAVFAQNLCRYRILSPPAPLSEEEKGLRTVRNWTPLPPFRRGQGR
jgi:hypothetical protein